MCKIPEKLPFNGYHTTKKSLFLMADKVQNKKTQFIDLGLIPYKEAWDYQEKLFDEIVSLKREISDGKTDHKTTNNYLIF
jgi:lipoyl(octanoyl) transferase